MCSRSNHIWDLTSSVHITGRSYHSIIMPTLQKYAGLGFGGESFKFDDVKWFRGRAFQIYKCQEDRNKLLKVRNKFNIL